MKEFSIGGAWSRGIGFFSGEAAGHAVILIGIGILAPAALQYLLTGGAAGMNPAMMGQNAFATMAYMGAAVLFVTVVGYLLQTGSYFASWRLGLDRGDAAPAAILYGLIAAVVALALLVALFVLMGLLIASLGGGGSVAFVIPLLLLLIPLMMLLAALYTVAMTLFAVAMFLLLLLAMAFGASAEQVNPAFSGGGGAALLIALAFILLLFWLIARFSCATLVMAERKSLNLFGAIAESWRMTAGDQWRIMAYLALLGIVLCVGFFVFALIIGVSMMSGMQPGEVPEMGAGTVIVTLIVSIPFSYLTVLVPAGIYLELYEDLSAEVFA